jgi:hypothetical protein
LRELATGHAVACHFAEEVAGSPEQTLQVKGSEPGVAMSAVTGAAASAVAMPPTAPQSSGATKPSRH